MGNFCYCASGAGIQCQYVKIPSMTVFKSWLKTLSGFWAHYNIVILICLVTSLSHGPIAFESYGSTEIFWCTYIIAFQPNTRWLERDDLACTWMAVSLIARYLCGSWVSFSWSQTGLVTHKYHLNLIRIFQVKDICASRAAHCSDVIELPVLSSSYKQENYFWTD